MKKNTHFRINAICLFQSSVLQLLLNELRSMSGRVHLSGPLAYASQEPWLFVATVRQNILFGLPYNSKKYKEVTRFRSNNTLFIPRAILTIIFVIR